MDRQHHQQGEREPDRLRDGRHHEDRHALRREPAEEVGRSPSAARPEGEHHRKHRRTLHGTFGRVALRLGLHRTDPPGTMTRWWAGRSSSARGRTSRRPDAVSCTNSGSGSPSSGRSMPRGRRACTRSARSCASRGLFVLLIVSPKRTDLRRDGRYALHSYPREDDEDAFYVAGTARPEEDLGIERHVRAAFLAERPGMDLPDFDTKRCSRSTSSGACSRARRARRPGPSPHSLAELRPVTSGYPPRPAGS